jgi:uncharacterized repeat protein (TIGR01451 family)
MNDDPIFNPNPQKDLPRQIIIPTRAPWYKSGKMFIFTLLSLAAIGGIVWYFFLGNSNTVTPGSNNVSIQVKGPSSIASGAEAEFRILYHNGENGDLTNLTLNLIYPNNFTFKSATPAPTAAAGRTFNLPILKEGQDGEVIIRGKLSGSTGEDKQIQAKLHYKLSNFNSEFEVQETLHVTIQAPNLTFDISGPVDVPVGQDSTFTLNYSNVSNQDYDNVAVSLVYPGNFKFTSASQNPSKGNNYWSIGKLPIGGTGKIDVTGSFMGQNLDQQILTGQLGLVINNNFAPQINSTATFKLKSAPISVKQTLQPSEVVNLGSQIQVTIEFSNSGTIGLTNLIITDTINSSLVDTSKLNVSDAVITGSTITWNAATNSNLSLLTPGGKGQVQFSIPLKESLTVTAKNQIITNSVSITSAEITSPIKAADQTIKLATDFNLDVTGSYVSGAQPMQVGKPTTYSITYTLTNSSNDLENVEVIASMPLPPSAWKNVIVPTTESSRLTFDPTAGKIRWKVGNLAAFTGKLTPAAKVTFQIVVTPSPSDQNQYMRLLSDITPVASDNFAGQTLTPDPISQFTTSDIGDNNQGGTVQ